MSNEESNLPSASFPQNQQVSDDDYWLKLYVQSNVRVEQIRAQLEAAEKRVKELEEWKRQEISLWLPILDYCQYNKNAERLGIRLGESITKRVLEILKTFNQPGGERDESEI